MHYPRRVIKDIALDAVRNSGGGDLDLESVAIVLNELLDIIEESNHPGMDASQLDQLIQSLRG